MCDARISDLANQLRSYWLYDMPRHMPANQITGEFTDVQINNYGIGSYDIADGFRKPIAAGTTTYLMYWVTTRPFEIQTVGLTCPTSDGLLFSLEIDGTPIVEVDRTSGTWTINTEDAGSTDTVLWTLGTPVSVAAGTVFATILINANAITRFGYGFGCRVTAEA